MCGIKPTKIFIKALQKTFIKFDLNSKTFYILMKKNYLKNSKAFETSLIPNTYDFFLLNTLKNVKKK